MIWRRSSRLSGSALARAFGHGSTTGSPTASNDITAASTDTTLTRSTDILSRLPADQPALVVLDDGESALHQEGLRTLHRGPVGVVHDPESSRTELWGPELDLGHRDLLGVVAVLVKDRDRPVGDEARGTLGALPHD